MKLVIAPNYRWAEYEMWALGLKTAEWRIVNEAWDLRGVARGSDIYVFGAAELTREKREALEVAATRKMKVIIR